MSKQEAERLAAVLRRFHANTPVWAADDRNQLEQAAQMLEHWPDGEPVGKVLTEAEMGIGWDGRAGNILWWRKPDAPALLYTAQPVKPDGEPVAFALRFEPDKHALRFAPDKRLNLSTVFDTLEEAQDYASRCTGSIEVVPLFTAPPAKPDGEPVAFDHGIGAGRFNVVKGAFWWHIRIGNSTANVGKFHSKRAAEDMALKLLTAFRDGAFLQSKVMSAPPDQSERIAALEDENANLVRGLREATEPPTFMGEPVPDARIAALARLAAYQEAREVAWEAELKDSQSVAEHWKAKHAAENARIAALEAALDAALGALENVDMAPLVRDALRAIEEVRK